MGKKVAGAPGMHSGVYEVGALFLLPNSKKCLLGTKGTSGENQFT